jgi:4'-phosphopantetheinyl transferase
MPSTSGKDAAVPIACEELRSKMLDVWYSISPPALPPCLDAGERARRDRFVFEKHRHAFAQAHTLKRLVLSCYEPDLAPHDWRFENSAQGKPAIVQPFPYQFNLSHSGSGVAVAIAEAEVGVDIELCRSMPRMQALAETVFHPDERRWLWRQPSAETGFFRLWTLKEAVLKAAGTGLSYPPARFCCEGLDGEAAITARIADSRWRCLTRYVGDFALSVAVPHGFAAGNVRHLCIESKPQPVSVPGPRAPAVSELMRHVRVIE